MLSHDIANLSTGSYYEQPQAWYNQLKLTLAQYECVPEAMPEIHTYQGKGFINYNGRFKGRIFFSWHKMSSGHLKIICYKC